MKSNKRRIARSGEQFAYVNGIGSFENPHSLRCACFGHPFFLSGLPAESASLPLAKAWRKIAPESIAEVASRCRGGSTGPALSWEGAMFSKATVRGLTLGQCVGAKAAEGARQHVRRWLQCTRGAGGSHPAFVRCSASVSPAPAVSAVRTPVCGVVAVAHVAGVSAETAFAEFKQHLQKTARWRGRTTEAERRRMLEHYKVRFELLGQPRLKREGRRGRPKLNTLGMQLQQWAELCAQDGVWYLVTTSRHCQVVRDGIVTDQGGTQQMRDFWGRRKHVKSVLHILNLKVPARMVGQLAATPVRSLGTVARMAQRIFSTSTLQFAFLCAGAFTFGWFAPSMAASAQGQMVLGCVMLAITARLSLRHPAVHRTVAGPARRSLPAKTLARQVFRLTGDVKGEDSMIMRQPLLAGIVWRLRDTLTYQHWIRDDADHVRGLVVGVLASESRRARTPPLMLGAVLLAQESTVLGDRRLEIIFQIVQRCACDGACDGAQDAEQPPPPQTAGSARGRNQRAGVWQHPGSQQVGVSLPIETCIVGEGSAFVGEEQRLLQLLELHVVADGNALYPHLRHVSLVQQPEATAAEFAADSEQARTPEVIATYVGQSGVVLTSSVHGGGQAVACRQPGSKSAETDGASQGNQWRDWPGRAGS